MPSFGASPFHLPFISREPVGLGGYTTSLTQSQADAGFSHPSSAEQHHSSASIDSVIDFKIIVPGLFMEPETSILIDARKNLL